MLRARGALSCAHMAPLPPDDARLEAAYVRPDPPHPPRPTPWSGLSCPLRHRRGFCTTCTRPGCARCVATAIRHLSQVAQPAGEATETCAEVRRLAADWPRVEKHNTTGIMRSAAHGCCRARPTRAARRRVTRPCSLLVWRTAFNRLLECNGRDHNAPAGVRREIPQAHDLRRRRWPRSPAGSARCRPSTGRVTPETLARAFLGTSFAYLTRPNEGTFDGYFGSFRTTDLVREVRGAESARRAGLSNSMQARWRPTS